MLDEVGVQADRGGRSGKTEHLIARGAPISHPNPGPDGICARLEEHGHTLARFTEDVAARMPTREEGRLLNPGPRCPAFR